ncbi:putative ER membrane protein complex subunit 1 [Cocos nucifera]|uniref:Putative ER membrane protein complex subunit 1 n=1 Tax=Cocos nucifera TaxID=13894 RepID=A0A8K0I3G8_COCNU|nr:putative ER membrane protein complex subunit 1 [Cocos nucifera]
MFAMRTVSSIYLVRVKGVNELDVIEELNHPASISDALTFSQGQQAVAMVQHEETKIHFKVKLNKDLRNEVLKETIEMDPQ